MVKSETFVSLGHPLDLSSMADAPYIAASLLRQFIAALPEPVFHESLFALAQSCPPSHRLDAVIDFIRNQVLPVIKPLERELLRQTCAVLHDISRCKDDTLMDADNLAICITPALLGKAGGTVQALEMCRVPGLSTLGRTAVKAVKGNTLAGMLSVMIER